jgi:hypothetical protein
MRSFLALGLLIAVCASATAAHSRPRHHGHSYGSHSSYAGYGSYARYGGYGSYGSGGFSGHNSSQWGGQPD